MAGRRTPAIVGTLAATAAFATTGCAVDFQPDTMMPEQVAKVARTIKPKVLFPYHYSQTPVKQVADLLAGSGIDVRIRDYR